MAPLERSAPPPCPALPPSPDRQTHSRFRSAPIQRSNTAPASTSACPRLWCIVVPLRAGRCFGRSRTPRSDRFEYWNKIGGGLGALVFAECYSPGLQSGAMHSGCERSPHQIRRRQQSRAEQSGAGRRRTPPLGGGWGLVGGLFGARREGGLVMFRQGRVVVCRSGSTGRLREG